MEETRELRSDREDVLRNPKPMIVEKQIDRSLGDLHEKNGTGGLAAAWH